MEIKWYLPAKLLGLVEDISHQYNDGYTHHIVSARIDEVFFVFFVLLIPLLFGAGFLLLRCCSSCGKTIVQAGSLVLLLYALSSAAGLGPYIQFYPQSAGFVDFSLIEHIAQGIYCTILSCSFFLGGKLASLRRRRF